MEYINYQQNNTWPRATIQEVLWFDPGRSPLDFLEEQQKDPEVLEIIKYLEQGELPSNDKDVHRIVMQFSIYSVTDKILYYVDRQRGNAKRTVVPRSLRDRILAENHSGPCAGHLLVISCTMY